MRAEVVVDSPSGTVERCLHRGQVDDVVGEVAHRAVALESTIGELGGTPLGRGDHLAAAAGDRLKPAQCDARSTRHTVPIRIVNTSPATVTM